MKGSTLAPFRLNENETHFSALFEGDGTITTLHSQLLL
jgi:hypothetical protein